MATNIRDKIEALPLPTLEQLSEAIPEFRGLPDLITWLDSHTTTKIEGNTPS